MMEKTEGSKKLKEDTRNSSSNPPWIELLDSLIEEIIEKLPLVDYIRFGAICKRWNSIQKEHRVRYSPKPPPIAPSVVLVNYKRNWDGSNWENDKVLLFQLPFEQKKYHLPLPYPYPTRICDSCCGWLLTYHNPYYPTNQRLHHLHHHLHVYNPVTGVMIDLPVFSVRLGQIQEGSFSAPPTEPNCCVIITTCSEVLVLCLRDLVWVKVQRSNDHNLDYLGKQFVYANSKFYGTSCVTKKYLSIVDPFLPKPTEQILELEIEEMTEDDGFKKDEKLAVIDGELFLVIVVYLDDELIKRFHVFKANFATRKWIRATNLGDYAMFLSDNVMSLQVSSVEGFRRNLIYFTQKLSVYSCAESVDRQGIISSRVSWMTFDMDRQEIAEGPSFLYDKVDFEVDRDFMLFWFFPTV